LAGGVISASSLGRNRGSDLNIQASDILVSGFNPIIQLPSTIATTTFSPGNGGDLMIDADRILVKDIGIIASSTLAQGSAGQITLRASQWIESNGSNASINSSADRLSPIFQKAFGLPAIPTGSSNRLNITTPQLRILNGGEVSVRSDGPGRAGSLTIDADSIHLKDRGKITASTVSGNGGNIKLNVNNSLIMRNNSIVANDSFGTGDGGETIINTPVLVGLGNSDIKANAIQGTGGTIKINTQGVFGLKYRSAVTPENDITASSDFGINGNVQVNTIGINPTNALNALPVNVTDSSRQMADQCSAAKTSSFIATGRGGMPPSPMKTRASDRTWHDLRTHTLQGSTIVPPIAQNIHQPIVEASAIEVDETGAIDLVAPKSIQSNPVTCAVSR
jgi:large exoprotein involved in heme utilization and adhesion